MLWGASRLTTSIITKKGWDPYEKFSSWGLDSGRAGGGGLVRLVELGHAAQLGSRTALRDDQPAAKGHLGQPGQFWRRRERYVPHAGLTWSVSQSLFVRSAQPDAQVMEFARVGNCRSTSTGLKPSCAYRAFLITHHGPYRKQDHRARQDHREIPSP